jgi:hypothetical protein
MFSALSADLIEYQPMLLEIEAEMKPLQEEVALQTKEIDQMLDIYDYAVSFVCLDNATVSRC